MHEMTANVVIVLATCFYCRAHDVFPRLAWTKIRDVASVRCSDISPRIDFSSTEGALGVLPTSQVNVESSDISVANTSQKKRQLEGTRNPFLPMLCYINPMLCNIIPSWCTSELPLTNRNCSIALPLPLVGVSYRSLQNIQYLWLDSNSNEWKRLQRMRDRTSISPHLDTSSFPRKIPFALASPKVDEFAIVSWLWDSFKIAGMMSQTKSVVVKPIVRAAPMEEKKKLISETKGMFQNLPRNHFFTGGGGRIFCFVVWWPTL